MPETLWSLENEHGRGYIYKGGDGFYNAYLRCSCSNFRPRYKHFENIKAIGDPKYTQKFGENAAHKLALARAQTWIARHLETHNN